MMRIAVMRKSLSGSLMSFANHSFPLRSGFSLRKSTSGRRSQSPSSRHIMQTPHDDDDVDTNND